MATAETQSSSSRRRGFAIEAWIFVLLLAVFGLWCWWLVAGARLAHRVAAGAPPDTSASAPTLEQLGQMGDLFGGLNVLFAAFAFVGVAWAAGLQRRALLDARAAYEVERRAIARQQFEGTFFHLLTLLREIGQESQTLPAAAESMAMVDLAAESSTFRQLADVLFASIRTAVPSTPAGQLLRELVSRYESEVHAQHSSALGRYFRALHQTLDLIDSQADECLNPADKVRYANIVRGQIPESLLFLLAVNGLRRPGRKTRRLVASYGLLKYLHADHDKRLGDALRRAYGATAFAGHATRLATRTDATTAGIETEWWLNDEAGATAETSTTRSRTP